MEKGLISIDRWAEQSQAYFLTHLHADHTRGLSPSWSRGPLFCSPTTASLLPTKFPGFDASLLRGLHVGSTSVLTVASPLTGAEVRLVVTVVDAHHCPGAVMYLFRGEFGCVLYTGDFRWESTSERAHLGKKTLLEAIGGDSVDVLYLDNTYCNPSFEFPPREVAAQQVVDIISRHPDHEIIIGVDTLGKEDLLLQISQALSLKIWVWPERLRTMHLLGFFDVFTTDTSLTRVRAVPRYSLTFATVEALNTLHPTIGIMPSGLPWGRKPLKDNGAHGTSLADCCKWRGGGAKSTLELDKIHEYAYSVPYSEHSCFSEIKEFIKIVQPSSITGIVSSSTCYINPRHYCRHLYGISRVSDKPCQNFKTEIIGEAEAVGSSPGRRRSKKLKASKDAKIKDVRFSVRRSRVCILRRKKQGAKIAD